MYKPRIYFIENLFFLLCLFPFVSPYPIGTDVQPLAGFVALFVTLIRLTELDSTEILLLLSALLSIVYINPFYSFNNDQYTMIVMSAYGILVFIAARLSYRFFNVKVFFLAMYIYFFTTILTLLLPSTMFYLQSLIVRHVNVDSLSGIRGVSVYATEPGLLAGLLVGFLLINDYFKSIFQLMRKQYYLITFMLLFELLATKSGSAFLFLFVYCLMKIKLTLKRFTYSLVIVVCLIIFLYFIFPYLYAHMHFVRHNRGAELLYSVFFNSRVISHDNSIWTRIFSFSASPLALINFPFGVGVNGYHDAVKYIVNHYGYFFHIVDFQKCYYNRAQCAFNSSLTNIIIMYGFFAVFLFLFVFFEAAKKVKGSNKAIAILYVLASYSLSFPMIWLLISLNQRDKEQINVNDDQAGVVR